MAGKKNKNVHRLSELEVHEVSSVDRPANKRPFLVVKNDDGETPLERDEKGNLVAPSETPAPAPATPAPSFSGLLKSLGEQLEKLETAEPVAKRLSVSDEQRAKAFKTARDAMRRIDVAMATMSMADVDEEGSPEFMGLISNELADVSKLLSTLARGFKPKSATAKAEGSEAIEKAVSDLVDEVKSEVEKAGRKMASRRLSALREAIKTLTSLLSEVDPKAAAEKAEASAKIETLSKALDESLTEGKRLAELVAKQAAEIKKHRSARGGSNAVPVETITKGDENDDDDWPLDMNNERRPDTVDKSVSFY